MRCSSCGESVPADKLKCPHCKSWNTQLRTPEAQKGVNNADDDGTIILSKVTSAEEHRLDAGCWNPMWGGGVVRTSTTLIAGTPGAGKSTMMLQILSIFALGFAPREVLVVAAEECLPEIRMRADRIDIKGQDYFRMVPAMKGVDNLSAIMMKYKPSAILLDSLQGLATDDPALQKQLCKIAKEYAIELECPIFIISHVNKSGDFAGAEALQHEVDTTLLLTGENQDPRLFEAKKNRFGRCCNMMFDMTAQGLIPTNLEEGDDPEDSTVSQTDDSEGDEVEKDGDNDEECDEEGVDCDLIQSAVTRLNARRSRSSRTNLSHEILPERNSLVNDDQLF